MTCSPIADLVSTTAPAQMTDPAPIVASDAILAAGCTAEAYRRRGNSEAIALRLALSPTPMTYVRPGETLSCRAPA